MNARHLVIALGLVLLLGLVPGSDSPPVARGQNADDFAVPGGWFYSQANGKAGGGDIGFTVTNEAGIPFWDWFGRYGGVATVGYPVSDRFEWNGFVVQAFQKLVFQWRPESNSVAIVNVFDEVSNAGKDDWLLNVRTVPRSNDWSTDNGKAWAQVVASHQALLDQNQPIRQMYFSSGDPVSFYGLPMATADYPNVFVVRAQRVVFQQWKADVPWAKAGQVVIANGGDVGKEAGLYPTGAIAPKAPNASRPMISANGSGSPGAAPTPTPAPAVNAPLPAGAPAAKSDLAAIWHKPMKDDVFMNLLGNSGAGWARTFLEWEFIEPAMTTPPTFNWGPYDAGLKLLVDRGVQPYLNLVDAPDWAAFPTCGPTKNDQMAQRWLMFVRAAVERYSKAPYNVKYWVLYNEPDFRMKDPTARLGGGWGGGCWGNNAKEFGQMLRATYPVIKSADPGATVVMGPLASDGCGDFNCDFLKQVMDPAIGNAADSFDMASFNYFSYYRRNWEQYGTSILGKAEGLRRVMASIGKVKPLIVAETGMWIEGSSGKNAVDQEIYIGQVMTQALVDRGRAGANGIQIATWFNLRDSDDPEDRWGLATTGGKAKSSYTAFQTWVKEMAGARYVRNESESTYGQSPARQCDSGPYFCDALQKYIFAAPSGEEKWVLWIDPGPTKRGEVTRTNATRVVELPADRIVAVRDRLGNPVTYKTEGNRATLTLTESPIYATLRR